MVTWSLIGVGIAGRARARALLASEHDRLAKVWRGRFAGELGVPVAKGFDEALEGVEAVAIASPSEHHPAQVRAALQAGRHVVCEFPLARTPQVARELFTLARRHERILHVEHIELLEPAGRTLCAQAPAEVLQSVSLGFQRPGPEGAGAPSLAHANVARVHRLVALAGPVRAIRSVTHRPGHLQAVVATAAGIDATLSFEQAPYLRRGTRVEVVTPVARWEQRDSELTRDGHAVSLLGRSSLFASDQRVATARILEGASHYVDDTTIVHVLDVVDRLARGAHGAVPEPGSEA